MLITRRETGTNEEVQITALEDKDLKKLTQSRYFFDWKKAREEGTVYKLSLVEGDDILGLISLIEVSVEKRVEIALLCVSRENKGRNKKYDTIAGCLIAFACRIALEAFGIDACVSLIPKTELKEHYKSKYNMLDGGWQMYLEGKSLKEIIIKHYI
ncbi:N-acetyltransferase [Chitinophaga pinensis]|uniref:N-acetyltransferase n=1 Tax=Chitinophaga pinensis TaxID=79329 RepID=A0A5C6LZK4_9BACT|nr:N-acetyltransferase [Chitinophaga pinensis]TWW01109.1 N-acetyltransferase [Chitinophaga pinensis]